jgi:transposase-like protein
MNHIFTQGFTDTQLHGIWREARFGGRTRCIRCGWTRKFWNLADGRWQCKRCKKKFGWCTDTPLAGFKLSLRDMLELLWWFELGLTDHGIADRTAANYHNVHRFFGNVRRGLQVFEDQHIRRLEGQVEVDETYFGASFKNRRKSNCQRLRKAGKVKRGRGAKDLQQPVFGIYQRQDGLVYVEPVAEVDKPTLQDIIKDKVSIETMIYSDTWKSYQGLDQDFAGHETVNHSEGEYVNKVAGINGIEGFWGYAKERLLRYHGVSPANFLYYLKEIEFRFNHRRLDQQQFVKHVLFVLIGNHSSSH